MAKSSVFAPTMYGPLDSGSPTKRNKIRSGYLTPAFSGAHNTVEMLCHRCNLGDPSAKRGEQNQKWSPTKGNKIRSGCLSPAVWGSPMLQSGGQDKKVTRFGNPGKPKTFFY